VTDRQIPLWAWAVTISALALLIAADLVISGRRRRPASLAEAALWTAAMIALAVAFGALIGAAGRGAAAGQFFAGWLTEYSLSLDNLLVFVLLISGSGVARRYHGRVLLLGILLALLLRGVLIWIGGAALRQFGWAEYVFGGLLIFAAIRMAVRRGAGPAWAGPAGSGPADSRPAGSGPADSRPAGSGPGGSGPGGLARAVRSIVPVAPEGEAGRLTVLRDGRRYATPLLLLAVAVGVTDLLFALDSIPAIYGLTRDPFLVFSANLFGLLERLVYLPVGLAVLLGFIGIKLIGEAMRGYGIYHLGPVPVPAVSATVSLAVIAGVLAVTAITSLVSTRHRALAGSARQGGSARQAGSAGRAGRPGLADPDRPLLVRAPRVRRADGAGRPRPRP
jgi:predicted tellurium resistance membrane protein TerC